MRGMAVSAELQRPGTPRAALLLILATLSGCGQTGPLYLPEYPAAETASEPVESVDAEGGEQEPPAGDER